MSHPASQPDATPNLDQRAAADAEHRAATSTTSYGFSVSYSFPLVATHDAFDPANNALVDVLDTGPRGDARVLVFVDEGIASAVTDLEQRILRWFGAHAADGLDLAASPIRVTGSERAKADLAIPEMVARSCAEHGICRHSYVLVIGGGAVLDAVGLGAALAHRGVRLVRMPTTVLAQNDAGLGVKNGVNAFGSKNFLGSFAPPYAVVNDSAFLTSLPLRHWRAGIAEAVKVAVIKDRDFLHWISDHAADLANRDQHAMCTLIDRCAHLHLDHICSSGDPFEHGSSRPLDFGHWSAHRLEVLSDHRLCHGDAVAIGVALDCLYAVEIDRLSTADAALVVETLNAVGFELWDEVLELRDRARQRSVLAGIEQFREHLGGQLTIAMPDGLGKRADIHSFDNDIFERCVHRLRRYIRQGQAIS